MNLMSSKISFLNIFTIENFNIFQHQNLNTRVKLCVQVQTKTLNSHRGSSPMQKFFGLKLLPWRFSRTLCRSHPDIVGAASKHFANIALKIAKLEGDKERSTGRKRNQLHYYHFIAIKTSQSHSCAEVKVTSEYFRSLLNLRFLSQNIANSALTFYVTFNVDLIRKTFKKWQIL